MLQLVSMVRFFLNYFYVLVLSLDKTLVNLISGTHSIDLSDYDSFSSIETKNYYLPGDYTVYVTLEDDVLILEYERFIGRLGQV